ncbi:MAG: dihydropteroate synthase [bacterium]
MLTIRGKQVNTSRTLIMGILNITPDSFFDGNKYLAPDKAIDRAFEMIAEGADIIDIGGESTKPGATRVSEVEEIARIIPVIKSIKQKNQNIIISVDTYKNLVAKAALEAGAEIINDVYAGQFDNEIMKTAAGYGAGYVLMHMQGTPETMQNKPAYSKDGVIGDIKDFFAIRIGKAIEAGLKKENLILDPGIGFGKSVEHNLEIIKHLKDFKTFELPLLFGPSRKSFIGKVLNLQTENERLNGTQATVTYGILNGADIVRVHDVRPTAETVKLTQAIMCAENIAEQK